MPRPLALRSRLVLLLVAAAVLAARPAAAAFPIGHVSVHFYDASRGNRDVGVELYYPATAGGNGTPVATPSAGGFPIVAFGHGFQMIVQAYQNIWEGLVPEGFVVALPINEGGLLPSHSSFGADLSFVIASLRAENLNPASTLYGKLGAKAAVMGHSMGGGASFLSADADPSIDALAVLAAANTTPSSITAAGGISVPTLIFSGSSDCVAPASIHQIPMYNASASTCKSYVSITGAGHCQFGINNTICNLGEIFCGSPGISRSTQHAIVKALLVPWLNGVLKTDWQAWQSFNVALAGSSGFTSQQSCAVNPAPPPECTNGADDDVDGFVDFPADAGCNSALDPTEAWDCEDGLDNDGDGAIDAADPACGILNRAKESLQCSNGVDDDGDLAVDLADSLCQGAWDDDEASNPPPSGCGLLGPEALLALVFARRLVGAARRG